MYKNLDVKNLTISGTQNEVIELALSFRFQGMSIDMVNFSRQVAEYGLPHARRLIDSARIKISTFRLPFSWDAWEADGSQYKQGLAELPKIAEMAASFGCTRCLATVQPASDERPYHENFEFHRKRIVEIADLLKPHNIRLGLEFLAPAHHRKGRAFQFLHTFDALVLLAKSSAVSNIGVVVDLWQMHVGGSNLDEIKTLRPEQIIAVNLSDLPADATLETIDESEQLLPGETGVIDSTAALVALAELGYDGPVSPQANRKHLGALSREATVKRAGEQIDKLWKAAGLNAKGQLAAAKR